MKKHPKTTLTLCSLCLMGSALAEPAQSEVKPAKIAATQKADKELETVTVTATRTEQKVQDIPASVSVITAKDIAKQQPRLITDVLRNVEGVTVDGTSLSMGEGVYMRGLRSTQILMDGLPVDSQISQIKFGIKGITPFDVEQVDVVRGPASALYGANTMGGVVNFIPKRWRGKPGVEVDIGGGSHNTRQVSAAVGGAWDMADIRLSATDYRTDGFIAKPEDDGYGKDLAPRDGKRQTFSLLGHLRPSDNQEITLAARYADFSAPWFGGRPNYRVDSKIASVDLGYSYIFENMGLVKLRYRYGKQTVDATFDKESEGRKKGDLALASYYTRWTPSHTLDAQADLHLIENNTLTAGVTYQQSAYHYKRYEIATEKTNTDGNKGRTLGIFIQDEHQFTPKLSTLLGMRWDYFRFYGDYANGKELGGDSDHRSFNPRIGLNYKFNDYTSIYANVGTSFIPPQNVFYRGFGTNFLPNLDIKPEKSISYELGARYQKDYLSLRAALFHTDYKDRFVALSVSNKFWPRKYFNIGRVEVSGFELGIDADLPGGWKPYANYSYTDSVVKSNPADLLTEGKRMPEIPVHQLNFGLTYAPNDTWYAHFAGRYQSATYYWDARNLPQNRNPGHLVADFKAGYHFPVKGFVKDMELSVAVNNIFDKRYSEFPHEWQDGRNFWIGLNTKF